MLALLLGSGFFAYSQWQYFELKEQNADRRQALNAAHHYLQEIHYPKNESYPSSLPPELLDQIANSTWLEERHAKIMSDRKIFRYEPAGCNAGACQTYTLRADLEEAEDYIRRS